MITPTLQVAELAHKLGADVRGQQAGRIVGLRPLATAEAEHVSFFVDPRYRAALAASRAGALLVPRDQLAALAEAYPQRTLLGVDAPALAAVRLAEFFAPKRIQRPGVHPTAWVAPTAHVDAGAELGPCVVVEAGAHVAAGCTLHAHAYVGEGAHLDVQVELHPGAKVLAGCRIGARSILHAGCVVGSDGFGYVPDPAGGPRRKVPQLGHVVVGRDVELGANTTVDRATFGATEIGDGCKIDNLVMVAHNVKLGPDCVLVSQSGVAGSAQLGARVVAGAQSGVVGHVRVADDVQLAARSGVSKDVTEPGTYGGLPLMPHRAWLRLLASLRSLPNLRRELTALQRAAHAPATPTKGS